MLPTQVGYRRGPDYLVSCPLRTGPPADDSAIFGGKMAIFGS